MIDWEQRLRVDPGPVPPELRPLLNELFASDLAAADPYIVDLNLSGSPTPLRSSCTCGNASTTRLAFSIRAFLELFPATTPEEEEPAYLRFKQLLFETIHPTFAQFLDPRSPARSRAGRLFGAASAWTVFPRLSRPSSSPRTRRPAGINPSDQIVGVEINGDAPRLPGAHHRLARVGERHRGRRPGLAGLLHALRESILYDGRGRRGSTVSAPAASSTAPTNSCMTASPTRCGISSW